MPGYDNVDAEGKAGHDDGEIHVCRHRLSGGDCEELHSRH